MGRPDAQFALRRQLSRDHSHHIVKGNDERPHVVGTLFYGPATHWATSFSNGAINRRHIPFFIYRAPYTLTPPSMPNTFRQRQVYTLDKSPVYRWATRRDKQAATLTLTPTVNLELPISLRTVGLWPRCRKTIRAAACAALFKWI